MVTDGAFAPANPVGRLCAFDAGGELALQSVAGEDGHSGQRVRSDGPGGRRVRRQIADCQNAVDFALAYGAALGLADKVNSVSLPQRPHAFSRQEDAAAEGRPVPEHFVDDTPVGAGGILPLPVASGESAHREALRAKLEPDYLAVMPGKTKLPDQMKTAVYDLERTLRIVKAEKTGVGRTRNRSPRR